MKLLLVPFTQLRTMALVPGAPVHLRQSNLELSTQQWVAQHDGSVGSLAVSSGTFCFSIFSTPHGSMSTVTQGPDLPNYIMLVLRTAVISCRSLLRLVWPEGMLSSLARCCCLWLRVANFHLESSLFQKHLLLSWLLSTLLWHNFPELEGVCVKESVH